jgi:hypothetical protein
MNAPSDCDVTSATAGADGVVLSFGQRELSAAEGELRVRQLHQVVLAPAAAVALRQMLAQLLADHQQAGGRGAGVP